MPDETLARDERSPEQRARDEEWEQAIRNWVEVQPWAGEWRNVPCTPEAVAETLDGMKEQVGTYAVRRAAAS
jgi:hypothetical protein